MYAYCIPFYTNCAEHLEHRYLHLRIQEINRNAEVKKS